MYADDNGKLMKIYKAWKLGEKGITISQFNKVAERECYRPWKDLVIKDSSKEITSDNITFGYTKLPTEGQTGLDLESGKLVRNGVLEKIHQLHRLGRLLEVINSRVDSLDDFLLIYGESFDYDLFLELSGYARNLHRCLDGCLEILDNIQVYKDSIRPEHKFDTPGVTQN